MERSSQFVVSFLLVFAFFSTTAEPASPPRYCDPSWLGGMATDCVGGLEEPRLPCCEMVLASVGMGFGEEAPCLCFVVMDPDFLDTGLTIDDVLKMYPVCKGGLPVGPHTADACKGIN